MTVSNVTQKGQVTVPVDLRKALGLRAGSKVRFSRQGQKVFLEAVREPEADSLFAILSVGKGHGIKDIDAEITQLRGRRTSGRDTVAKAARRSRKNQQ